MTGLLFLIISGLLICWTAAEGQAYCARKERDFYEAECARLRRALATQDYNLQVISNRLKEIRDQGLDSEEWKRG